MTDYKTMRVPEDAYEQAKADKRDEETWGDFLQRCSNNPPEIREFVETENAGVTYDDVKAACAKAIRDELPEVGGR